MSLHSIGYLFREGLKSLWKNRTMSVASIGVLIACLLMTGIAFLLSLNLSTVMEDIEGSNNISVFLDTDVPSLTAVRIGEEIRALDNIASCTFVPKDTGLSDMMTDLGGSGTLFEALAGSGNPLPDSYEISIKDLSLYDQTVSAITAIEGVGSVTNYSEVADRLSGLDRLVHYASIGIVALLAVVSLFIIVNTVKVTIFSRRMEISIMKSVGATNWFVRWPFVVEGMLLGLTGALIAFFAQWGIYQLVAKLVIQGNGLSLVTVTSYLSMARNILAVFCGTGALIGVGGSLLAIRKFLQV